ncbi:lysophospholipid acyltransferase family protein [Ramlibacter tataouinensis]|uniref:Acyltransferases-like protein n=1 Tax=Ramlibacter tataouinensis (strain ATCC BAA-407 / DSM 14655 / LMG 21543 / TTB310) TaxID=365046 RepID=F5XY73_RAMTT|nr:lysophospholipid acyltransferase family protein [Ramlibacter tataouinensis]AEG91866.1 Acyltransferases-like protein [Ramlibacter tataouinensis TTB310]
MLPLFRLLSVLPLRVLHALGAAIGWLAFALSPTYRRRFLGNIAQAGLRFAEARPAVAHIGRMVAELPRLWLGRMPPIEWDNAECVDRAYARGAGVLFLTPHLGCFEVTAQALAQRYAPAHGPLTVLFRPARKAWLAPLVAASRGRPGLEAAPTTLAGVRQMIKALRSNRAVGLLPDQVPPDGMGVWVPFFGRPAYTMTLAARLALQTGAEVRLVWGERLPGGRGFRLHFRELLQPLQGELEPAVAQLNEEMARLIRECPQQYLWSYARYKAPRAQAAKS